MVKSDLHMNGRVSKNEGSSGFDMKENIRQFI